MTPQDPASRSGDSPTTIEVAIVDLTPHGAVRPPGLGNTIGNFFRAGTRKVTQTRDAEPVIVANEGDSDPVPPADPGRETRPRKSTVWSRLLVVISNLLRTLAKNTRRGSSGDPRGDTSREPIPEAETPSVTERPDERPPRPPRPRGPSRPEHTDQSPDGRD